MIIKRLETDCPNGKTCHNIIAIDTDPDGIYVQGDTVDPDTLEQIRAAGNEVAPHERIVRFPRYLWERSTTR